MNATDLNFFKAFLLSQKSSILNKTSEFKSEQSVQKDHIAEEAEAASADLSLNLSIQLLGRNRDTLYQIERALAKFDEGTYGECESCSDPIEMKRLKARPTATLCIVCQEEQEDPRLFLN